MSITCRSTTLSAMPVDVEPAADAATEQPSVAPKRRRWLRIVLIIAVVLAVLAGGAALAATLYARDIDHDIARVAAFDQVPQQARPVKEKAAGDAMNFLVLGSDTRNPETTGGSRSDTIILLHLQADHSGAQAVSIPRDTWVHVPRSADGRHGNTDAKINAAFAWGGTPLMVQTVEDYTGVRIDHVMMVDFAGFKGIVDALGGVDVDVEQGFTSTHSLAPGGKRKFAAGQQTMDGATALDYARERYAFSDGDFARIRHQQQVIMAVMSKATSSGVLTNPGRLNSFLRATAGSVTVDETLNIFSMAGELRDLRGENLSFYTSPTAGTGTRGDQSVVLADRAKAKIFFDAVRRDDTAKIAATGTVK
jgi:LCP family protein required for cell wall assembly